MHDQWSQLTRTAAEAAELAEELRAEGQRMNDEEGK